MDKYIDIDKLIAFCKEHTIVQSAFDGELLVVIGQTSRGDDIYKSLYEFDDIISNKQK